MAQDVVARGLRDPLMSAYISLTLSSTLRCPSKEIVDRGGEGAKMHGAVCVSDVLGKYLTLNTNTSIYTYKMFTFAEKDQGQNYLMPAE